MKYCPNCGHDLSIPSPTSNAGPITREWINPLNNTPFVGQVFEVVAWEEHPKFECKLTGIVVGIRTGRFIRDTTKEYIRVRIYTDNTKLPPNLNYRLGRCVTPLNPAAENSLAAESVTPTSTLVE
jgi:hypothetical protein